MCCTVCIVGCVTPVLNIIILCTVHACRDSPSGHLLPHPLTLTMSYTIPLIHCTPPPPPCHANPHLKTLPLPSSAPCLITPTLYSHPSSVDGAYEIADADRKTFFTKAGRPVRDGGGEDCRTCIKEFIIKKERLYFMKEDTLFYIVVVFRLSFLALISLSLDSSLFLSLL